MSDIDIRITGRAGRITLTRPEALNALTYDMCLAIEAALDAWAADDAVALVVFDAAGDRAFCAGGDIGELYERGIKGDFAYGQKFWADEYRLNHKISVYGKPVVSFLQGFTLGGGVGIGCHGTHRVVGDSSKIAMPECGIGLVPDVGGSLLLARAPGHLGEYLGTTTKRMDAGNAIYAGFADHYLPEAQWPHIIRVLEETGDVTKLEIIVKTAPAATFADQLDQINALFGEARLADINANLAEDQSDFAAQTAKYMGRNAPLSMACTLEMMHRLRRSGTTLADALELEYRFTFRASEHGDFLEGIRAAIIDKDRTPAWQFTGQDVPAAQVDKMLHSLGDDALKLEITA